MGKFAHRNQNNQGIQNNSNTNFNTGDKPMNDHYQISIFDFVETYIDNCDPLSKEELQRSFAEDSYCPDIDTDALFFEEYLNNCDPENNQGCSEEPADEIIDNIPSEERVSVDPYEDIDISELVDLSVGFHNDSEEYDPFDDFFGFDYWNDNDEES